MGLNRRQGDLRKKKIFASTQMQKGGELPCKRCGFYYPKYGDDVKKRMGTFVLCRFCYDSLTD